MKTQTAYIPLNEEEIIQNGDGFFDHQGDFKALAVSTGNKHDKDVFARRIFRPVEVPVSEPEVDLHAELKAAFAAGKQIQWRDDGKWFDVNPTWLSAPECYRIKPESVKVPLGPEDVPPGSVVGDFTKDGINHGWTQVIFVTRVGIGYAESSGRVGIESFQALFDDPLSRISRDGGKTWQPCWKEVAQ